jgi:hypothetical protein
VTRGVGFDGIFQEKTGGLGSHRLFLEQIGAEVSTRICDLESPMNREEKEIVEVKAEMSEEIEKLKSASNTEGILLKAKQRARPSNRRRNIRVYIP